MRRRDLILGLAGGIAGLSAAGAQESRLPVVGFLRSTPSAPFDHLVTAFRAGLAEAGIAEGRDAIVEYRWANNDRSRLAAMAAEFIERRAAVVVGNSIAVDALRSIGGAQAIVFVTADDPVKSGYVASLGQPGGNITGVTFFAGGQLGAKRLELLHEFVPSALIVGVLSDPNYPGFSGELPNIETAARKLGLALVLTKAADEKEFEAAFAGMARAGAGAVLIGGSPVFTSKRDDLVRTAARHRLPTIYDQRDHVLAGGLISHAASFTGAYREAGVYAGRILKGAKPSELPVLQPTSFELTVNLKAAAALGLTVPESIMLRADEVID